MRLVMQIGAALLLCLLFGGMFVAGWAADIFDKIKGDSHDQR